MDWSRIYSKNEEGIPLVMPTSSGLLHGIRIGDEKTLCGQFVGYNSHWGNWLVKNKFRAIAKEDEGKVCSRCYDRFLQAGVILPWSTSIQAVRRLSGVGIFSAQEHGEDRVSISVDEVEALISLFRRGR